ncbi:MAG: polymer-forming cytoskeletal protein [Ignavibacteriaceae bacterium]|nr:polymer-forming cytoskeletal protein [Ignavibacteriaceae bacterium]
MKNKTVEGDSEEITIISHGVKLEGKITCEGNVRIDGTIQGDVISHGNVTVGEQGEINGQVNGQIIIIGGKVSGEINAKENLTLESKANLKGDVFAKILVVEAGAYFDGKSNMGESKGTSGSHTLTSGKNETGP